MKDSILPVVLKAEMLSVGSTKKVYTDLFTWELVGLTWEMNR